MPSWFWSGRLIVVVALAMIAFGWYASTKPAVSATTPQVVAHIGPLKEGVTAVYIAGHTCIVAQGYATNSASSISITCP